LIIMNDPFVSQQAEIMAKKLLAEKELSFEEKISWLYVRAFSRKPIAEELEKAKAFIAMLRKMEHSTEIKADKELQLWQQYCHSLFNLKEFIYLI